MRPSHGTTDHNIFNVVLKSTYQEKQTERFRSHKIPRTLTKDSLTQILSDFAVNHPRARIIVMFVNEDNCR